IMKMKKPPRIIAASDGITRLCAREAVLETAVVVAVIKPRCVKLHITCGLKKSSRQSPSPTRPRVIQKRWHVSWLTGRYFEQAFPVAQWHDPFKAGRLQLQGQPRNSL